MIYKHRLLSVFSSQATSKFKNVRRMTVLRILSLSGVHREERSWRTWSGLALRICARASARTAQSESVCTALQLPSFVSPADRTGQGAQGQAPHRVV